MPREIRGVHRERANDEQQEERHQLQDRKERIEPRPLAYAEHVDRAHHGEDHGEDDRAPSPDRERRDEPPGRIGKERRNTGNGSRADDPEQHPDHKAHTTPERYPYVGIPTADQPRSAYR